MKVAFWMIGKTAFSYIGEGMDIYIKRLRRYLPFEAEIIPDVKQTKHLSPEELKKKEGLLILKKLKDGDLLILLDEKGKTYDSLAFAKYLETQLSRSKKRIVFQIGGAYGFSEAVYQRADAKLSLSKMTFSHQMIRLFLVEQIYRAMTILKGEPYHNA